MGSVLDSSSGPVCGVYVCLYMGIGIMVGQT